MKFLPAEIQRHAKRYEEIAAEKQTVEAKLAVELDSNGMKKMLVAMFCSKLDSIETHTTTLIKIQSASLESLRILTAEGHTPTPRMTDQERLMLDAIQKLKEI